MKALAVAAAVLACVLAPASSRPAGAPAGMQPLPPLQDAEWVEAYHAELPAARVTAPGVQGGGMGASAFDIRMGRYQGSVIETRLDTGVIALFLGWDIAADACEQVQQDVRVVFVDQSGAQHVVPFQAGSCNAMLFTSPSDLASTELAAWVLQRKASAAWAEEATQTQPPSSSENGASMNRVTGIGGVFFKSKDPKTLRAWYQTHLGIDVQEWGGATFRWKGPENPEGGGTTAWMPFSASTSYFAPSTASFMINYRVEDLHALLAALRAEGVQVDEKVQESEDGKFGWIIDPEGNKVELWQPPEGK